MEAVERKVENFDSRAKTANVLTNEQNNTHYRYRRPRSLFLSIYATERSVILNYENPSMLSKFSTRYILKRKKKTEKYIKLVHIKTTTTTTNESLSSRQSADVKHELGMDQRSSSSQSKERHAKCNEVL